MISVNKETLDFYELVERALEGLPPELWPDYSTPLVAEDPDDTLYGLYEGVPLTERSAGYHGMLPDKITIFRGPLERDFSRGELEKQIRVTVVHEIAHHFGIDEDRLEELGWG
jgi:predicted Zn-dependent protease with MMP-like domain